MGSNRGGGRGDKSDTPLGPEQTNEKAPGSEQTDQTTAASDWGDHCIENCLYHGHHDNKDMVRCCQCASWVHNDCISQREEFVPGVWSCFRCRLVPTQVQDLVSSVAALTQLVTDLSETTIKLQKQHETTASLLKEKEDAYQKLLADNQQLRLRVAEVSSAASEETWRQFPRPHGTVLLGSSVIRDIDQTKLVATKCICIRGGHIKDIQGSVDRLPNDRKLCRIVLAVGGNDCDSGEDKPVTDIVAEYKDLIESAKTIAKSVTVSSVCPRRKSTEVTERIDALNAGLQGLCSDLQVDFIDNNPAFHLQDGSFNEGYLLPDNVHLTRAATNKLVSNLKLEWLPTLTTEGEGMHQMAPVMSLIHPPRTTWVPSTWLIRSGKRSSGSRALEGLEYLVASTETTMVHNPTMPPRPQMRCSIEESPLSCRVPPTQPYTAPRPARDSPCARRPVRPGIQVRNTTHIVKFLCQLWPSKHARQHPNAPIAATANSV